MKTVNRVECPKCGEMDIEVIYDTPIDTKCCCNKCGYTFWNNKKSIEVTCPNCGRPLDVSATDNPEKEAQYHCRCGATYLISELGIDN